MPPRTFEEIVASYQHTVPRARATHFNIASGVEHNEPLCHATARSGQGFARSTYTHDVSRITCKRCITSMLKVFPDLADLYTS